MNARHLLGCFLLLLAMHASAGAYEDGVAAYDQRQFATALKLWLPLAEQGNAAAQFNVAVLYEKGLGTTADVAEAARWYLKAAQQGDPDAQYSIAVLYETGSGVVQDVDEARKWYADVMANARAGPKSSVRQRARARLTGLSSASQEVIAYDGGRFVVVGTDPNACVVALQGKITHDTSFKFDDVIAKTAKLGCDKPWLLLESPGGLINDGISLAKEVRYNKFRTITRYECASACSLIFLAGTDRVLLGSRARIGFHQASIIHDKGERHCSSSFDEGGARTMRLYLASVIPDHAEPIMRLIMQTPCNTIAWMSGQPALDAGVATRLESESVDVFGAKVSPKPAQR